MECPDGGCESRDSGAPEDAAPGPCGAHEDCTDGTFCNGVERCVPGDPSADPRGCAPASAPQCGSGQTCEEGAARCVTECGVSADADGDGEAATECGGNDCDDTDPAVYPGAPELCDADGRNEDCNAATLGDDDDGDGEYADACCNRQDDGALRCGRDCDDTNMEINSGTLEVCNGLDDDCDGAVDEGVLATFYADADGDLHGDPAVEMTACSAPAGYVTSDGDCDDDARSINPGAEESCNGVDDDCDTVVDEEPVDADTLDHCGACGVECRIECTGGVCEDWVQVSAGRSMACGVTSAGGVYCWGSGALGDGLTTTSSTPVRVAVINDAREVAVGGGHACAIRRSGDAWCWGGPDYSAMPSRAVTDRWGNPFGGLGGLVAIRADGDLTCGLLRFTTGATGVYCWGANERGQQGIHPFGSTTPTTTEQAPERISEANGATDIAVGGTRACALLADGSVVCWGEGALLGDGVADHGSSCGGVDCATPTAVPGLAGIVSIGGGARGACATDGAGATRCWGIGDTPSLRADLAGVTEVEHSERFGGTACATAADGTPLCWGDNRWGAVGDGTTTARSAGTPVMGLSSARSISVGFQFACAVDGDGVAWCWGDNRSGQLGDGVDDHMMGGCSDMMTGPRYDCALVPVRVARP